MAVEAMRHIRGVVHQLLQPSLPRLQSSLLAAIVVVLLPVRRLLLLGRYRNVLPYRPVDGCAQLEVAGNHHYTKTFKVLGGGGDARGL